MADNRKRTIEEEQQQPGEGNETNNPSRVASASASAGVRSQPAQPVTPEKPAKKTKESRAAAADGRETETAAGAPFAGEDFVDPPGPENEEGVEPEQEEEPDDHEDPVYEEEHADENEVITGDTIMGFPRYPETTNRDIMLNHFGFVRWARGREDPSGRLADFVDWSNSEVGRNLELERQGNERFNFGQHRGCTFREIAVRDPTYHHRYMHMLERRNEEPNGVLSRYIDWFNSR